MRSNLITTVLHLIRVFGFLRQPQYGARTNSITISMTYTDICLHGLPIPVNLFLNHREFICMDRLSFSNILMSTLVAEKPLKIAGRLPENLQTLLLT